jgi:copper homeostasis protein (lipoprotein)
MKQVWGIIVLLGIVGCIEHSPNDPGPTLTQQAETKFIQQKTYKGYRIFEGQIPCADCSGIQQRLVLKGDTIGIYRLTEVYKDASEDGDATIISTGEWQLARSEKSKEKQLMLSQGHLGDSVRIQLFSWSGSKIRLLEDDGEKFQSSQNYILRLTKQAK